MEFSTTGFGAFSNPAEEMAMHCVGSVQYEVVVDIHGASLQSIFVWWKTQGTMSHEAQETTRELASGHVVPPSNGAAQPRTG